jgi:hypothetical protein
MRSGERGQSTVETALVLPVVVVLVLVVLQVGLLVRDQITAVHAARAAARAVAVRPETAAAQQVVAELGLSERAEVRLSGEPRPGGLATVTVVLRPVAVPVVGAAMRDVRLSERMTVRVEGS